MAAVESCNVRLTSFSKEVKLMDGGAGVVVDRWDGGRKHFHTTRD